MPVGMRRQIAVNHFAASLLVVDSISGQVGLQQAHRTPDVKADRAGIVMRRRRQHTTDRRSITTMRIGVQDDIRHGRVRSVN